MALKRVTENILSPLNAGGLKAEMSKNDLGNLPKTACPAVPR
jgi:hypothetical protein